MSIESQNDLMALLRIGRIVGLAIQEMAKAVEPGISTGELDDIGAAFLAKNGARSAPQLTYKFPGVTCISINEEAAHGIPGIRAVKAGDLVNIDVSAELDGYFADAATTVAVPPVSPLAQKLCDCAQTALEKGIAAARAGQQIFTIGQAMEAEAKRNGFKMIRDLPGHGVGRKLHEPPSIPGYFERRAKQRLEEGMVFTIEPFVSSGTHQIKQGRDGWTLSTRDGSLNVQYEHTIVVTKENPILVTAV